MKKIPFLNNYFITKEGEVYSNKRGNKLKKLKQTKAGLNYYRVPIVLNDGTKKKFLVHRLVALTYIPKPEDKDYVNHLDGDKLNNSVENLEWSTSSDNQRHAYATGLKSNTGTNNPRTKLSEDEVREIYDKLLEGVRTVDVAREYGLTNSAIGKIKTKSNWYEILKDLPDIEMKNKSEKLSTSNVEWICEMLELGHPCRYIQKMSTTSVKINVIEDIKRRRGYKHISNSYKF